MLWKNAVALVNFVMGQLVLPLESLCFGYKVQEYRFQTAAVMQQCKVTRNKCMYECILKYRTNHFSGNLSIACDL